MFNIVIEPLAAGAVGAGVAYLMEDNKRYMNMENILYYAGVVAGCQFVGKRLADMLVPELKNSQLRSMQRIGLGAATCGSLNIIAQRYVMKDLCIENSLAAGAAGGGFAPLVSSLW